MRGLLRRHQQCVYDWFSGEVDLGGGSADLMLSAESAPALLDEERRKFEQKLADMLAHLLATLLLIIRAANASVARGRAHDVFTPQTLTTV